MSNFDIESTEGPMLESVIADIRYSEEDGPCVLQIRRAFLIYNRIGAVCGFHAGEWEDVLVEPVEEEHEPEEQEDKSGGYL